MTSFWSARTPRERQLLIALAVIGVPVLIWLLVLRPLEAAHARAEARLSAAAADTAYLTAAKASLAAVPAPSTAPLVPRLQAAASAAGLTLASLDPAGQGSATLRIAAARAPVLLRFVGALEAEGIIIASLSFSRNQDNSVTAQITAAAPAGAGQ